MFFSYANLSHSRKHFIDVAVKEMPHLLKNKTINRQEMFELCNRTGMNPAQWLTISANSVSRGVFHFPVPNNVETQANQDDDIIIQTETDEEILERITKRFGAIDSCVRSVAAGDIKSMILSGSPGVGKTHEVNTVLKELDDKAECDFVFMSGRIKATGLYKLLYDNRFPSSVLVLDDMDSIFAYEDSLNILKKACDLEPSRKISWLSETKFTSDEDGADIPRTFDYEGSVIFITNIDFDNLMRKDTKLSPHLDALISRSLYINLGINTTREILLRVKQVMEYGMLTDKGFSEEEQNAMYDYMVANADNLRELSLRMLEKISIIYRANPDNWQEMTRITCFKK